MLVVEDEALIARKLKKIINKIDSEMNVFITGSAGEALEYAEEQTVDLFCLDIQLEDYNGIELAKKIRNLSNYTLTPIIFITAIPTRELIAYKETHCY
ncbi:MAG: response regulator, partial [Atribacterota bacterium]|nr:response regulator [Atribacterota bacterium]